MFARWFAGCATIAITLALAAGCHDKAKGEKDKDKDKDKTSGHAAGGHKPGPHKGIIDDFGKDEKYHTEFTRDKDKKMAVVYLIGEDEIKLAPSKTKEMKLTLTQAATPASVDLEPWPMDGETKDACSRFKATHDSLGDAKVKGKISGFLGEEKEQRQSKFEEK